MANNRSFGRRMGKDWTAIQGANLAFTADATMLGNGNAATTSRTVLRMLGGFTVGLTSGGTFGTGDKAEIAVGIAVVSTDAFAAGAASMPDPGAEPEFPWLYWQALTITAIDSSITGNERLGFVQRKFDVRTMRRMKVGQSLAYVVQYADITGAPPIDVDLFTTRVLVGLH